MNYQKAVPLSSGKARTHIQNCFIQKSLFGITKFIFPLAKLSFIPLGFQEGNTKFRRCIFKFSQSATNFPQEGHKVIRCVLSNT